MQYWELNRWRSIFVKRANQGDKRAQEMIRLCDTDKQSYIERLKPFIAREVRDRQLMQS
jgi:hypothetical protein